MPEFQPAGSAEVQPAGSAEFQRARSAGAKQQREEAILAAATRLGAERGIRQVTLTEIAHAVGMHKSAMLRYFETREQIFLELTAQSWLGWAEALHAGLDGGSPGSAGLVADVAARSFADRPLLCDLIPHTALNHERHVSTSAVRRYKLTSLRAISDAADVVRRVLPDLTGDECREFISTMANLAGSLWQIANPPPALARLYASDPDLALACVDLLPRLRRTAVVLLAGMVPSRSSA